MGCDWEVKWMCLAKFVVDRMGWKGSEIEFAAMLLLPQAMAHNQCNASIRAPHDARHQLANVQV